MESKGAHPFKTAVFGLLVLAVIALLVITGIYHTQPYNPKQFTTGEVVAQFGLRDNVQYPVTLGASSTTSVVDANTETRAWLFSVATENSVNISSASAIKLGFVSEKNAAVILTIPIDKIEIRTTTSDEQPSATFTFHESGFCASSKCTELEAHSYWQEKGDFFTHAGRREAVDITHTAAYKQVHGMALPEVVEKVLLRVDLTLSADDFQKYLGSPG